MNGLKRLLAVWPITIGLVVVAAMMAALWTGRRSVARADQPSTRPYVRPPVQATTLPTEPGDHKLKFSTVIQGRTVKMSYLLHLPDGCNDPTRKLPMLVFLHGMGEVGTDLGGIYSIGPMTIFRPTNSQNPTLAATNPFIILCPQCPPRGEKWNDDFIIKATVELVRQTVASTRCDPDRVYATGLSMGGLGTWCVAEEGPDLFAAIAPLSAMPWHPESAGETLKDVPVWTVTGLQDEPRFVDGERQMEQSLRAHSRVADRFTYIINQGHWVFAQVFASPQYYEWFLSHRRGQNPPASPTTEPAVPTTPGHHLLTFNTKIGDQPYSLEYVLYVPKTKPDDKGHPAMLFMHERDTIGPDYHDICMHGPDLALERDPALGDRFPFVVISPRLPFNCEWNSQGMAKMLLDLVEHVGKTIPIDPDRISVAGIDAGANGAWRAVEAQPGRFSAVTWVFTKSGQGPLGNYQPVLATIPGRAFVAANNQGLSKGLDGEFAHSKQDWKTLPLPAGARPLDDLPAFGDKDYLEWLAKQRLVRK